MDQDERDIVRREIEGWLEEGAIDHDTGNRLRDRYRGPGPDVERASEQLMGVGAHLLGFGILFLVDTLGGQGIHTRAWVGAITAGLLAWIGIRAVRHGGEDAAGRSLVVAASIVGWGATQDALLMGWITLLQAVTFLGMGGWLLAMVAGSRMIMVYAQFYLIHMVGLVLSPHGGAVPGLLFSGWFLLGLVDVVAARLVKDAVDPNFRRTANIQQVFGVWNMLGSLFFLARSGWYGDGQGIERPLASLALLAISTFLLWVGMDRGRFRLRLAGSIFLLLEITIQITQLRETYQQIVLMMGIGALFIAMGRVQNRRRRVQDPSRDAR